MTIQYNKQRHAGRFGTNAKIRMETFHLMESFPVLIYFINIYSRFYIAIWSPFLERNPSLVPSGWLEHLVVF